MRGFIGCDADLDAGDVITTGLHMEIQAVVIRAATEDEARQSAESLGHGPLVVAPGERFYEVEVTTSAIGSSN